MLQHKLHLLTGDSGEPFEEIIDPRPAFEVLEQGSDGNARAFEQPLAADFARNTCDRWALAPVKHASDSTGGDVLSQGATSGCLARNLLFHL